MADIPGFIAPRLPLDQPALAAYFESNIAPLGPMSILQVGSLPSCRCVGRGCNRAHVSSLLLPRLTMACRTPPT